MKGTKLYLDKVLDYCDEPILFVARDDYDTMYLCMVGDDRVQYLASKITKSLLEKLVKAEIDVREVLSDGFESKNCYAVNVVDDVLYRSADPFDAVQEELLPESGYILPFEPVEKFTVTVPKSDQSIFRSIVKRFGWIAM